jgi:hypothetical protein
MQTAILLVAVGLAAAACPTVAWIQRQRGRSSCCAPSHHSVDAADLARLRAQRAQIEERIAALETGTTPKA